MENIILSAKKFLFPKDLIFYSNKASTKKSGLHQKNGGWADLRDHELCLNISKLKIMSDKKMNSGYRCQFHQHFYLRIFRTNVISAAFSSYVLALAKNSYEKRARLTLMKLTAGFPCYLDKYGNVT